MASDDTISADIVARFENQRTPRYTSYPTAPHFTDVIADRDYRALLADLLPENALSLYLHVPFCRSMCWYCGCHTKIVASEGPIEEYLEDLKTELRMVAAALPRRMNVQHIHWGGGTPTIIGAGSFADLMELIRRHFNVASDAEIAIEMDPRRVDDTMIRTLGKSGVTRASLGVQSFDARVQEAINRVQSYEQTARATEALRAAGVNSVNVDLIYGLPYQTVGSCEATVARTLQLGPDQLSVFGYAHVPWMKKHQRMVEDHALPDARQRLSQFAAISEGLTQAGYRRIGLDHFARPGDRLDRCLQDGQLHRNFQGYTGDPCRTLLGFGASAIGTLPDAYVQNTAKIADYGRRIQSGVLPIARGRRLSADDRLRRDVIERLMCEFRVDLDAIAAPHGLDAQYFAPELDRLKTLQRDGVVDIDGPVISIAEPYWPLVRTVASGFDAYLQPEEQRHARAI
jgi:oxygen-independent coproporphyrinogen-3 oxidase